MLSDYAVRVLFINAPETAVMDTIPRAFAEVDSTGMLEIERWCVENGAIYGLDGDTWWMLSAFTKEVPMNFYGRNHALQPAACRFRGRRAALLGALF